MTRTPWIRTLLAIALVATGCTDDSAETPLRSADGEVDALVASFRTVTNPDGVETIERIAAWDGKVRLPDERSVWRLFDVAAKTVTIVDEIDRTAHQVGFERALSDLRAASLQDQGIPVASIRALKETESVAGFEARLYVLTLGRGYERELFVSRRPLIHSDFYLLRLATDPIRQENLPALRSLVRLLDDLDGYPVIDRSRMTLDGVEYTIDRRLIAVAEQRVPASWFQLPAWAIDQLTAPPAGPPPAASPRTDRSAPTEESRPSGSDRTDP